MKFLHIADMHFDTPFKTLNSRGNFGEIRRLDQREIFKKIEDNYNIKITKYNEEIYKKGFIDGVNLMLNCLK